jgi:hypothetical protein
MYHVKFVPLSLFAIFALKSLILGATLVDAPLLLIIGSVAVFYEIQFQTKNAKILHKRLDEVDKHLSALYKNDNEIKADIASAKLTASMRQANFASRA